MPVLDVRKLTIRYGTKTVLENVDLQLEAGQIYGLAGPNGSGKSTLLRALCGLVPSSSGDILICGDALTSRRAGALRKVGYVAQRFALYPDLTVDENLRFYARCHGFSHREVSALLAEALEQFQLNPVRTQVCGTLSHGWSQRVALAAAACHKPELMLLDETTAGLDAEARRDFWDAARTLSSRGAAVLLATHHTEDSALCARLGSLAEAGLHEARSYQAEFAP
ncbi:MAG TPA: heme ABC exporter ATP-binding protein CcmA [Bryobacteraceae bacterium]|jgi:ABC-2 type transport system ATP-binding protein